jgi:cell division protein FtsL
MFLGGDGGDRSGPSFSTSAGGLAGLGGLGFSLFGGLQQMDASKEEADISKNIAGYEQQINEKHRQAMELDANRQQMQTVRTAQVARATALQNATTQGAQQGSGLQGGYGGIAGQTGVNQLGISQNLQIGENLFDLNNQISQQKMRMADAKSKAAQGQGLASFGGDIMKAIPNLMKLAAFV